MGLRLSSSGRETHLRPLAVAAGHVRVVDGAEEALGGDVLGQAREKLGHVDEVHVQEHVLVQAQDPQGCAEQELLSVSAEHVPDAARHVQRQGLAVECKNPEHTRKSFTRISITPEHNSLNDAGNDFRTTASK